MTDLLNGIPRVDATAEPPWMLRVVGRILSTEPGSAVHRRVMAPLANLTLVGRPFRAENGVVVALRRRGSMVLRGRPLARSAG
ncbi:MAG TPA: hypothetical protein VGA66_10205 [Mycobacterium sp.]